MEQKKTVLIVEDEKNIVDIIRFNLQRTGYDTLEAYDGEAGLAMAREKKPDLILLDGGKGHVGAIRPLLREIGIDVPVYGMVKDDKHRTRAITEDGGEIAIQSTRAVFTLVSSIQDEVHRFAIGYHRQQRKKATISTTLTSIPGIGETRAKALMKHFTTIRAVSEATEEMLEETPGMNAPAARAVYRYFHSEENDGE